MGKLQISCLPKKLQQREEKKENITRILQRLFRFNFTKRRWIVFLGSLIFNLAYALKRLNNLHQIVCGGTCHLRGTENCNKFGVCVCVWTVWLSNAWWWFRACLQMCQRPQIFHVHLGIRVINLGNGKTLYIRWYHLNDEENGQI